MGFRAYIGDELEIAIENTSSKLNKQQYVKRAVLNQIQSDADGVDG